MPLPTLKPDEPEFSIDTTSLGRLDALPFTIGRMSEIEKTESETPTSFINAFIATVGRNSDGIELTDDDVVKLSDAERDEFAKRALESYQYLFRERVREKRTDEAGRVVISFRDGDVKHQREEDESDSAYLFRLFKLQTAELKERARRMMAPFEDMLKANKRMFTPSFLEAFTKSQTATAQLGNMIDRLRVNMPDLSGITATTSALDRIKSSDVYRPELRVPDLSNIRNPVYDTNERLSEVVNKLDSMEELALQMAETVKSVSDAASQFIVDFGVATGKADRASRRAIWIAVTAVVVAALMTIVQIGYSEWRNERGQSNTETTINSISARIEETAERQRESMEGIEAELNGGAAAARRSYDRLSSAIEGLTEMLRKQSASPRSSDSDGVSVPSK